MSGAILDHRTRTFFVTEATRFGFIGQHHEQTTVKEQFSDPQDVPPTRLRHLDIGDGTAAVLYELPDTAVDRLGLTGAIPRPVSDREGNCDEEKPADGGCYATAGTDTAECDRPADDNIYAVEWGEPATKPGKEPTYTTLLFSQCPDGETVEQALALHRLEHDFRFGNLSASYECRFCGESVNWLAVPRGNDDTSVTLSERRRLIEARSCGRDDTAHTT